MRRYYVVRVNKDAADTFASDVSVEHACEMANVDEGALIEWASVRSTDAGAARLKKPRQWRVFHEPHDPMCGIEGVLCPSCRREQREGC